MRKFGFTFLLSLVVVSVLAGICFLTVQAQSSDGAEGGVFDSNAVAPGEVIEVPVEIRNVEELYAMDIEIQFDPTILQVEDADPDTGGIQIAIGTFLDAGLVLYNTVDNNNGTIHFVMTQVNPSEGKTGSGVVLVIYLRGINVGTSQLEVTFLELARRTGDAIPVELQNASIDVVESYVPVESTPIPVQDPEESILIPTPQPTLTPTITPTVAAEEKVETENDSNPSLNSADTADADQGQAESGTSGAASGFNLLSYWWVLLPIIVGAVFLVIYQRKTHK
ncbi:hypothetical protein JR338_08550 [Chloroflexota bacterium]|nr:hypothetical protein JR338_08550 [Chloroflexota bacterium]